MDLQAWQVLATSNPFPHLRVDDCRLPNGRTISKLVHEYDHWATVLAITEANDVVLVRQYRHGAQQLVLELPGGVIDAGESPLQAAQRELHEETGFFGGNWTSLGSPSPNPDNHTNRIHCFLAQGVYEDEKWLADQDEQLEVVRLPLNALMDTALSGGFLQAMHLANILLALPKLGVSFDVA